MFSELPTVPAVPTTSPPSFPRTVSAGGLTFTLPPELRFRTDGFSSSGESIDEFYGNVPLGSACSAGCGISSFFPLPPGAVVVGMGVLSGIGVGAPEPNSPAPNTRVAGQAAAYLADKPGECGGDETIKVWIPDPANNDFNDFLLRACLKGPNLSAAEQTIRDLLSSAVPSAP